jgi:hypothetical protein
MYFITLSESQLLDLEPARNNTLNCASMTEKLYLRSTVWFFIRRMCLEFEYFGELNGSEYELGVQLGNFYVKMPALESLRQVDL